MPTLPEISKITIPSGTYALKDEVARSMAGGGIQLKGETTTPLTDMATTNPITINGASYTAVNQDAVFYDHKEFVFDGTNWHEFGDLTGLGDLALKDNVTGSTSYTPAGSVSAPTVTLATTTLKGVTGAGTAPSLTTTVADETLTISFTAGTTPPVIASSATTVATGVVSSVSTPTFTGTSATISITSD